MFSCSHLQAGDGVSFPCCLRECAFSSRFRQRTMNQCPDMCQFLSISINKHTFLYCFFLLYTMVRPVKGSTNTKLLWQLPSGIFCHCDHRPSDEKIIIIFFGRICRYPWTKKNIQRLIEGKCSKEKMEQIDLLPNRVFSWLFHLFGTFPRKSNTFQEYQNMFNTTCGPWLKDMEWKERHTS